MWGKLKQVLGTIAPFLGNLIGGPLGGAAFKSVANLLLGKDDASPKEIQEALRNATPEQLLELKKLDAEYKTRMAELGIDEQKIASLDRDSARKREIAIKDHIPATLAIMLTLGFFGVLVGIMVYPIQEGAKSVIDVMLGSLGTAWISCVTYYFGSSAGSKIKTELLGHQK